jgi:hypothetical protein
MATFITSKSVGETITISVNTSTEYWKYNHNGTDSSVFAKGQETITVANANGEFTLISCLSDGTVSGDLTVLDLYGNKITGFTGTGLSSLTGLNLNDNQLTSFDGTGLTGLTSLYLNGNQLTSFTGTGLSGLTDLRLNANQLTAFTGTGLSALTDLRLNANQLTAFTGTGLSALTDLELTDNPLTSFIGGDMGLTTLDFTKWNITTLESFDISGMDSLRYLNITNNSAINTPPVNNTLLAKLAANELANDWRYGEFYTAGGRTAAGTTDYDYLIAKSWSITGVELTLPVTFITSKAVGQTITISVNTSTEYWKYNHNGTDSSVFAKGQETITVANANGEFTLISCLSDGTVSGDLTVLDLNRNQLTAFDGTGLSSLTVLDLYGNQLTSFDGTDLSSLTNLNLHGNPLISFYGGDMGQITSIGISDGVLESFNGTGLSLLSELYLQNNQLTSINIAGCDILQYLYVNDNPLTPVINNSLLAKLAANELANDWNSGEFYTSGGRTSAGTTDYDYLIANGWTVDGADLVPTGTGKLRVKGIGQINP